MNSSKKIKIRIISSVLGLTLAGYVLANDASKHADAISLKQAVAIAKKYTNAEPIEAEREIEMNQAFYQVKLVNEQGKTFDTLIHATSGDVVLNQEKVEVDAEDLLENAAWLAGIKSGQIKSLTTALEQAEAKYKAQAYEIEFDDDYGLLESDIAYEISLIDANGKKIKTHILAM